MPIKKGDKVKVEYEGKLEDGTVFDSSEKHGQPLEFEVGSGVVIKGFDDALEGMEKDEEKEVKLTPDKAYGDKRSDLVKQVPKERLPEGQEPKPGMMLIMNTPEGQQVPCTIKAVADDHIDVDFNHPLAGHTLSFKLKVVEIA